MSYKTFDPGRIGALSDGVFAIAMTLLVLNLQAPDVAESAAVETFANKLAEQLPGFISWLLSFAILCRLWTVHHDLLTEGDTRSASFVAWNFVFLGAVSFIPYPTALLAEHPEQLLSVVIFSSVYVVAGLALGRMRSVADAEIVDSDVETRASRTSRAMLLIVGTALLSCLLALVEPRAGAVLWFSYPITGGLVRRFDRQGRGRTAGVARV